MTLGKNQIREVAQMIKGIFTHVNYHVDSEQGGYAHMVQVNEDTFSPDDQDVPLSNRRWGSYANMAKRGIVTGSDRSREHTYVGSKGTVTYHTYYYLSPAQLGQYLADPKVLEALKELHGEGLNSLTPRHSTYLSPAGFMVVMAYINGTGEIPWLNGHDYWLSPENRENS